MPMVPLINEGDSEIKILFHTIEHPELNPVQMVPSKSNKTEFLRNLTFRFSSVEEIYQQEKLKFTEPEFFEYLERVKLEELKYEQKILRWSGRFANYWSGNSSYTAFNYFMRFACTMLKIKLEIKNENNTEVSSEIEGALLALNSCQFYSLQL